MRPQNHTELVALRKSQGGFYEFEKDGVALITGFGRVCADLISILSKLNTPADLKTYMVELTEWALSEELKERRLQKQKAAPAEMRKGPKRPSGIVYLIKSEHGLYKIGKTTGTINARLRALMTASPFRLQLTHFFQAENCHETERLLHERFASKRERGEWFRLSRVEVQWFRQLTKGSEIE